MDAALLLRGGVPRCVKQAEINKGIVIRAAAKEMRRVRAAGSGSWWSRAAVVHSGGEAALAALVREGWVDVILAGNAFAVHDLEKAIVGTSLGVCQMSGRAVEGQPEPPLRHQRGETAWGRAAGGGKARGRPIR